MSTESTAVKAYIYHPIDSSKEEIRLVTIKAGRESEPIECSLARVSLGEKPQYEALSYVWGDPNDRSQITLEGCNFSVTSNLGTALSYLRLPNATRTMWIDAICIDQSNFAERESQVQLMRNIFQEAEQVVSWLGALDTKDMAAKAASLLSEGQVHDFSVAWLRNALSSRVRGSVLLQIGNIVGLCTASFDYWNRIWITQEVALARKGVIKLKEVEIPYEYFVKFSKALSEVIQDVEWVRRHLGDTCLFLLIELSKELRRGDIVGKVAPGTPLLHLLQYNRCKNATDPRDKVYALLGLSDMAPNSHEGLTVSYGESWSKKDIYTGVVRAVVHKTSRLDIICGARPYANAGNLDSSTNNQEAEFPSWAPDWTVTSLNLFYHWLEPRMRAAGLTPANVEFCADRSVLKAQGIFVGTVGTYGRCLAGGGPVPDSKNAVLVQETLHEWLEIYRISVSDSADSFDAFGRTIYFGLEPPPQLKYILAEPYQRDRTHSPISSAADNFLHVAQRNLQRYRFFITDPNRDRLYPNEDMPLLFGLGPEELQEEDKICVLAGCKSAIALRPYGSTYRFVSPVFVDGLMDGQAIEGVETGLYNWDWFEIH